MCGLWEKMSKTRTRRVRPAQRLTPPADGDQAAFARKLCDDLERFDNPLSVERWASSLLGRTWERGRVRDEGGSDPGFALGAAIIEAIADVGGRGAKLALLALDALDDHYLSEHAASWAAEIEDVPIPDWFAKVGKANVIRSFVVYSPCEAEAIFIEADQPSFGLHSICVYVDNRWKGSAKHIELIQELDSTAANIAAGISGAGGVIPVEPELACQRILWGIWETDSWPGFDVGENYADLRALTLARAGAGPVRRRKRRARA